MIHDKGSAHKKLVNGLNLISKPYDSKSLKGLADKDNPLNRVNRVHALLKDFLNAHTGFDRNKLQGSLDLFSLSVNLPLDPLEKVNILLNLAFQNPKLLKYRDFYAGK